MSTVTLRNAILEARAALTGVTAVTDLVPARNITFGNSPQKDTMPRIVIEVSSAEYDATFTQSRKVQTFTVEYAVYSDSVDTCTAIMDEVRLALDSYTSSAFAVRVTDESFQAEVDNVLLGVVVSTFQDAVGAPGYDATLGTQLNDALADVAAWEAATGMTLTEFLNPFVGPLDSQEYDDTPLAVSMRRLKGAYTGPCMRIRRTSDNQHLDIGFDSNGDLDTAAIENFCAGTIGTVQTWYDQSLSRNHMTQDILAQQPVIYDNGAVITRNGKPAMIEQGVKNNGCSLVNTTFSMGAYYSASGVFGLSTPDVSAIAFGTKSYNASSNGYANDGYMVLADNGAGAPSNATKSLCNIFFNGVKEVQNNTYITRGEIYDIVITGQKAISVHNVANGSSSNGASLNHSTTYRMMDTQEFIMWDNPGNKFAGDDSDDAFFSAWQANQMTYFGIS